MQYISIIRPRPKRKHSTTIHANPGLSGQPVFSAAIAAAMQETSAGDFATATFAKGCLGLFGDSLVDEFATGTSSASRVTYAGMYK